MVIEGELPPPEARRVARRLARLLALSLEERPRYQLVERAAADVLALGDMGELRRRFSVDDRPSFHRIDRVQLNVPGLLRLLQARREGAVDDAQVLERVRHICSRALLALHDFEPRHLNDPPAAP